jgi:hypothetical protein
MVPQEQWSPEITFVLFLHYMQCSTTFLSLFWRSQNLLNGWKHSLSTATTANTQFNWHNVVAHKYIKDPFCIKTAVPYLADTSHKLFYILTENKCSEEFFRQSVISWWTRFITAFQNCHCPLHQWLTCCVLLYIHIPNAANSRTIEHWLQLSVTWTDNPRNRIYGHF